MTRCGTRWPPGTPPGRRGWSSGTSTRCSAAARARPCSGWLSALPAELVRVPPAAVPGPGVRRRQGPAGGGRGAAGRRRARLCGQRRRAVSSLPSAGRPTACWPMSPRRSRSCAPSSPSCAVTPRPRPRYARQALAQTGRGRVAAALHRPRIPGRGGMAARPARASRAGLADRARRVAGGRRALRRLSRHARLPRPRPGAARPGPPGCGAATYRQALDIGRRAPARPALTGPAHVGLAQVAYQRNELDRRP